MPHSAGKSGTNVGPEETRSQRTDRSPGANGNSNTRPPPISNNALYGMAGNWSNAPGAATGYGGNNLILPHGYHGLLALHATPASVAGHFMHYPQLAFPHIDMSSTTPDIGPRSQPRPSTSVDARTMSSPVRSGNPPYATSAAPAPFPRRRGLVADPASNAMSHAHYNQYSSVSHPGSFDRNDPYASSSWIAPKPPQHPNSPQRIAPLQPRGPRLEPDWERHNMLAMNLAGTSSQSSQHRVGGSMVTDLMSKEVLSHDEESEENNDVDIGNGDDVTQRESSQLRYNYWKKQATLSANGMIKSSDRTGTKLDSSVGILPTALDRNVTENMKKAGAALDEEPVKQLSIKPNFKTEKVTSRGQKTTDNASADRWTKLGASFDHSAAVTGANAPYGVKPTKINAKLIREAIPDNASCVFHILDRRVNMDAHPPNVSFYSLMRSWVQDDPYRQIPPPGSNLLEYVSLPSERRVARQAQARRSTQRPRKNSLKVCDLFSTLPTLESTPPSAQTLKLKLIKRAKRTKWLKRRGDQKILASCRDRLIALGIKCSST